ncbi:MAG: hypothetical protein KBA87_05740 [Lachnospiraceae bacterium]|nr:hypothetical protein [Lachnospiraceae bacterium]
MNSSNDITVIDRKANRVEASSKLLFYLPSALEVNTFAHGQAELIKYRVPSDSILDDKTLIEFSSSLRDKENSILIVAVERDGKVTIPNGDFKIHANGKVHLYFLERVVRTFSMSFAAVAACFNNIGPGLGMVCPSKNFACLSDLSKWVLSFDMLAGRL